MKRAHPGMQQRSKAEIEAALGIAVAWRPGGSMHGRNKVNGKLRQCVSVSVFALVGRLVLCSWLIGCSFDGRAPDPAPAVAATILARPSRLEGRALDAAVRIPIEQARGVVVRSDPERRARAFENGLVGRPPPVAAAAPSGPSPTAQALVCHAPPGERCDPPPPVPTVAARPVATDVLQVVFTCGRNAGTLVRTSPSFATLSADCGAGTFADTGLTPGTQYCYAMQNVDGSIAAGPACATTLWTPYAFNGPGLSQSESDSMAAGFDWTHTDPVAATIETSLGTQTALYSMNILVHSSDDLFGLRGLGIHTQTQPLLPDEQADAAWNGSMRKAMVAGSPAGVWITAIVPGPVYNDVRAQAIAGIASGHPIGIQAMVFRRIHFPGAAIYPNPSIVVSPLDPTFLAQQGIEFNGYSAVTCDNATQTCTIQQFIFGWLVNKLITIAVEVVQSAVDEIRGFIGLVERLVVGEVDVTVQLLLENSDEAFETGLPTRSGWNAGAPLVLRNLTVRGYQGLAEFTAMTDDNGYATLHVAKNRSGKVCVDLENPQVQIIDTFITRRVCVGSFSATSSAMTVQIATNDKYANELATMTDAADYFQTVMGLGMPQVTVLTGWQSALLTSINGGRSFTPCMGRMPNLTVNLVAYVGLVPPVFAEIAEFLTAYDIVMDDDDIASRGVGVHEYGHAAMCELLRNADEVQAAQAWADVIVASLFGQDASSQQAVIAEGFADFAALQVVGGTNYVAGDNIQSSREVAYCLGDSVNANQCLEPNTQRCDGAGCDFTANVKWAVSLLQDTFDRIPFDIGDQANPSVGLPNDGSHWMRDGSGVLVPHHASNQVSGLDRDTIQLAGPHLSRIFSAWAGLGSFLRYSSFFGGVAQAIKDDGFDVNAACAMFAAHEQSGTCPDYVTSVYGAQPTPNPPPSPNGIRFAYALADQPTVLSYQPAADFAFNGTGGGITINRFDTGEYRVTFDGLPASGPNLSASVAVTAFGSSTITCAVESLESTPASSDVNVRCWDQAAAASADSAFSILLVGNSVLPSPSAFVEGGGPAPLPPLNPFLSWTTGRLAPSVTHNAATGDYNVLLGTGNAALSAKLVTALGSGARCNDAAGISGGLEVKCYDRNAAPADGQFYTIQIAGGRPGHRYGFALANNSIAASYIPFTTSSFNSSGGVITITHPSTGHYVANFAGLAKQPGQAENVQVTADSSLLTTCGTTGWSNSADGLQVAIECRDAAGQLINTRYYVLVIE